MIENLLYVKSIYVLTDGDWIDLGQIYTDGTDFKIYENGECVITFTRFELAEKYLQLIKNEYDKVY
jgi:hypothetical protein